jgi:hypothetical protein
LVARSWDQLADVVADRPAHEQEAIASVMFLHPDELIEAGSPTMRSGLRWQFDRMRPSIAALDVPSELRAMRDETVELIDRNAARMRGETPAGAIQGWGRHPDYAEVGRIRTNVELLRSITDAAQHGPDDAARAADTLTW